ncbi:hypothetical protein O6H91_14G036700 [Diphasiastrum complanatum]|uniref:Uncharacterized protein n=1 Tax=Diphasiastrum complanatum TaxID=34168 RepID=A0ACC2BNX7_DIPCM|nr:hypothetical protein O6H91_14G036700 [Diphasiastrum complanatum]
MLCSTIDLLSFALHCFNVLTTPRWPIRYLHTIVEDTDFKPNPHRIDLKGLQSPIAPLFKIQNIFEGIVKVMHSEASMLFCWPEHQGSLRFCTLKQSIYFSRFCRGSVFFL